MQQPPGGYGAEVESSLTTERLRVRPWTVDDADAAGPLGGVLLGLFLQADRIIGGADASRFRAGLR